MSTYYPALATELMQAKRDTYFRRTEVGREEVRLAKQERDARLTLLLAERDGSMQAFSIDGFLDTIRATG